LKLVMAHARYRGWIVAKTQVAKVSASLRVNRADLEAAIAQDLERLDPGARKELERIAQGTLAAADSESETLPK
jgi:hypothetical protein